MNSPNPQRLPIAIAPTDGESWDSYLTRVADAHATTVQAVADVAGIRQGGNWPAFFGVIGAREMTQRAAGALGIAPSAVTRMHLVHYDGQAADLTGLDSTINTISAARRVAAAGWVYLAGSHYCPACLDETRVWQLEWRLPWVFCCRRHRSLLQSRCPACGAMPRSGRSSRTCRPIRAGVPHDGRRCTQPTPGLPGSTCLASLTDIAPAAATQVQLQVSEAIDQVLHRDHSGHVAGAT